MRIALLALALVCICSCGDKSATSEKDDQYKYLAVQFKEGQNWSIIDSEGKTVVEEEYPSSNQISRITSSGTYWVKERNKYSLYSVRSPKRPLSSVEYDDVTDFCDGRAFVSVFGEPLQIVDEEGLVIKTLPEEIVSVQIFNDGVAVFERKDHLAGYLDRDGKVAIEAQYTAACCFNEGIAVASKGDAYFFIDKKGNVTGTVDPEKYRLMIGLEFHEGLICAEDLSDNSLVFLDKNANVAVRPVRKLMANDQRDPIFQEGAAIVYQGYNEPGLIDRKGEVLIRFGKYSVLAPCGNGYYSAKDSNGRFGIIDKEENVIIPFIYKMATPMLLGDNFVMYQEPTHALVNRNDEWRNIFYSFDRAMPLTYLQFVNVMPTVNAIAELITPRGYKGLENNPDAATIAQMFAIPIDSVQADAMVSKVTVGNMQGKLFCWLDGFPKVEKTHTEVRNDGWSSHEVTVSDGYVWNPEAKLTSISLAVSFIDVNAYRNLFIAKVREKLRQNGFREEDAVLMGTDGDKTYFVDLNVIDEWYALRIDLWEKKF